MPLLVNRGLVRASRAARLCLASCAIIFTASTCAASPAPTPGQDAPPPARPRTSERDTRTAAQRKINSRLLFEIYRERGTADDKGIPPGDTAVAIDPQRRAKVDIRAAVTPALEKKVAALGGTVISTSVEYRSIVAWLPLLRLEELADDATVLAIEPAPDATTNRPLRR
jgi:hypothetical protein